ncbi:hypothetical protein BH09MYX1_BH09MYX1_39030 [soil metagenome]
MNVRIAQTADVVRIVPMMIVFNAHEEIAWDPLVGERALRRLIGDPSLGVVGIAMSEDAAVGYFVLTWGYDLEWDGRDAFLTELFVVESERGRGTGKIALDAIERIAKEHDARALHLMVRHENVGARRLYEKHGFKEPDRAFLSKDLRAR